MEDALEALEAFDDIPFPSDIGLETSVVLDLPNIFKLCVSIFDLKEELFFFSSSISSIGISICDRAETDSLRLELLRRCAVAEEAELIENRRLESLECVLLDGLLEELVPVMLLRSLSHKEDRTVEDLLRTKVSSW